ncbi:MAG: hypothetical protein A2Z07_06940 [Armatimonadetes bacterium RBG_16_67_12]|nr:MAG: hypothetical protein A2Z07_06940 [Armatimonadetes bacterium RBG_16_67_12]
MATLPRGAPRALFGGRARDRDRPRRPDANQPLVSDTGGAPGEIEEFVLTPSVVRSPSPHYLGYGEALAVGRAVGLDLPDEIRVLAVERTGATNIGAGLSDSVRAALPALIHRARDIVRGWSRHEVAA